MWGLTQDGRGEASSRCTSNSTRSHQGESDPGEEGWLWTVSQGWGWVGLPGSSSETGLEGGWGGDEGHNRLWSLVSAGVGTS